MFWKVIRAPTVWIPAALGAVGVLWAALSGDATSAAGLLGAGGMLLGAGAAAGRAVFFGDRLARELEAERDPAHTAHLAQLNELAKRLRRDYDQRTDDCLAKLRKLYQRLRDPALVAAVPTRLREETTAHVRELYDSCLAALERIHALGAAAREMTTEEARQDLLASREELFEHLFASVAHLASTIDRLQASAVLADTDEGDNEDLQRARDELDQGLEVARRVEERMAEIGRTAGDELARKLDRESP